MAAPASPAAFKVLVPGASAGLDELGVWQAQTAPLSFAVGDTAAEACRWQVQLPADPAAAGRALAAQAARLRSAEQALPVAATRLHRFTREARAQGPAMFSIVQAAPAPLPERQLAAWVDLAGQPASFGLEELLPPDWAQAAQAARAFLDRIEAMLRYFAWVESTSDGRRLAVTAVSWTGQVQTHFGQGLSAAAARQHALSLELALRTRAAWLHLAVLVARGGVQLAVLFPANPLLAVPAALKFIRQVLAIRREFDELAGGRSLA